MPANGDFEGEFVDGVAAGWRGHAGPGGGYFARNSRLGRIGGGLIGGTRCWDGPCEEDVQTLAMSAKVHLVDEGRIDMTTKIRESLGRDAIVVLKMNAESWAARAKIDLLGREPESYGARFADHCVTMSRRSGHWPRCYYGRNEPDLDDPGRLEKAVRFEIGFTRRLHEHGCRSCVLNLAAGTPRSPEAFFTDDVRELLSLADYVGYHAYGSADAVFACRGTMEDHALRWRRVVAGCRERGWRVPPLIYTEGTVDAEWIAHGDRFTPEMVRDDLLGFGDALLNDPWSVGLCVFLTGAWPGQREQARDITKYPIRIIQPLRAWNRDHPVDAHGGTGAQVVGSEGGSFDRTLCAPARTEPGAPYELTAWLKFEHYDGQGAPLGHRADARLGFDPTGQTDDASAGSIDWSGNLVGGAIAETDIFYRAEHACAAEGQKGSVWIRFRHPEAEPSVRLCIDDVGLHRKR
jgi:hypothetical protein